MDVPADLYVLAIMGHSGMGGGTGIVEMNDGVNDYVSAYHRRLEICNDPIDADHVARYIDQGLPLMWSCWVRDSVEKNGQRRNERSQVGGRPERLRRQAESARPEAGRFLRPPTIR